ncbi:MAG TPA: dienelactone hydrolase family protein [Thermoplasmata archaeon]|nr:dienelactone hydrolase family protein [Thermoplasmata archaeon]
MSDEDRLLSELPPEFGSGVIGVCDVCGTRQAVIVLQKERFQLCVLDFLNKSWLESKAKPGRPLPPYRSERVWYPTEFASSGRAPAIRLAPTKEVRRPAVLLTPDVYGLTTTLLDAGIRCARAGFEVLLPDLTKTDGLSPADHLSLRTDLQFRGGVRLESPRVRRLVGLYGDALRSLRGFPLVDPEKVALFGAYYGAAFALALAGEDRRVAAVALASPVAVRPAEFLRLVSVPVLLLGGGADRPTSKLVEAWTPILTGAQTPFETQLESGVGARYLARDLSGYDLASAERSWHRLLEFYGRQLRPPPPKPPAPPHVVNAPAASPPPAAPKPAAAPAASAVAPAAPAPV